jgi:hypothetical protein
VYVREVVALKAITVIVRHGTDALKLLEKEMKIV